MNAATIRVVYPWLHLILSVPIIGYIYGPVADIPPAAFATRFVFVPLVVLSGLWMWKGPAIKKAGRALTHRGRRTNRDAWSDPVRR
jgi:hypothetical protein